MPVIRFRLNGVETEIDADPDSLLLDILRGRLGKEVLASHLDRRPRAADDPIERRPEWRA